MNLDKLSEAELSLLKRVNNVKGLMEDTPTIIDKLGIFDQYILIHKSYADFADKDDESLKRALFIQWYAVTEPSCFTGIPGGEGPFDGNGMKELDREAEDKVINLVEERIKKNQLDEELKWMLCYYGSWDFYFKQFNGIENILNFISADGYPRPDNTDLNKYNNRGQLGVYWISILEND